MEFEYTSELVERLILKRTLSDKKYLGILTDIFDVRWFDNKNISVILRNVIKFYKKYQKVPSNSIILAICKKYCENNTDRTYEDLNDELIKVNSLEIPCDDECANRNIERYIKEKAFYYAVSDSVSDQSKNRSLEDSVSKHLEEFEKLLKVSFRDDNLGLHYFSEEGMKKHWEYINNPEAKISTGWEGIDRVTHGGFLREGRMLSLFVGQAGLGKSLFLANIAVNFLKQNKTVVVISLEMSEDVYACRFDSCITEDDINKLKNTSKTSQEKIHEFYKEHPNANLIIKEYPPKSIRTIDIENYLEKLQDEGIHIDVIIIDYLNLVLPNVKMDNMYQSVMATSEQLRTLSYKFNAPVISATQMNRQGQNNTEVGLQNISESAGQGFTADFIGMLFQAEEDRNHGIIKMKICKNRFGQPNGVIPFRLNPENLILTDVTYNNDESVSEADMITSNLQNLSSEIDELDDI